MSTYPSPGTDAYRIEAERAAQEAALARGDTLRGSLDDLCLRLPGSADQLRRASAVLLARMNEWWATQGSTWPRERFRSFLGVALAAHDYTLEITMDDWRNWQMQYDAVPIFTVGEEG